ncbi:MAG: YggS family pyridoxal phosphate-dependent enzyme [Nitrospinota bacterium]
MADIASNLQAVRERVAQEGAEAPPSPAVEGGGAGVAPASARAGRSPQDVTLVAVAKTVPPGRVAEAIVAGMLEIGENRVQEAREKREALGEELAGRARWHLVGTLQRNKAKYAVSLFDLIHSVDSLRLAEEVERRAAALPKVQDVLVEVNVGREAQKGGVAPEDVLELLRAVSGMAHLRVRGLMVLPPLGSSPEESRPYFQALRALREEARGAGLAGVRELSMGMSADFEAAIEEGATLIRLGTALFGPRPARVSEMARTGHAL